MRFHQGRFKCTRCKHRVPWVAKMLHCQSSFASPRTSTMDDIECFFSVLRDSVGKDFIVKNVPWAFCMTCPPRIHQEKWFRSSLPITTLHLTTDSISRIPKHVGILEICELNKLSRWLLAILLFPPLELHQVTITLQLKFLHHLPHETDHAYVWLW